MTEKQIYEKLEKVFEDVFDEKIALTPETTADDVEDWDSLTHISLMAAVEDEFGVKFSMREVSGMKNVGEMAALIAERAKR